MNITKTWTFGITR